MYTQINAEQALQQARRAQKSALHRVYIDQVAAYGGEALTTLHHVIQPWWENFQSSRNASLIGWLIISGKLYQPAISQPVRYLREENHEWTAVLQITGGLQNLELVATQFCPPPYQGFKSRDWVNAIHAKNQQHSIPTEKVARYTLDLHPIVLIDFARQITTGAVDQAIEDCIRQGEQRPPSAYTDY